MWKIMRIWRGWGRGCKENKDEVKEDNVKVYEYVHGDKEDYYEDIEE